MSEQTGTRSGQPDDLDKGSDNGAATTRRDTPRAMDNDPGAAPSRERQVERQAEQESALQRWETEGGAEESMEEGMEEGAEDRMDGNEVAEIRRTDISEHSG